MNVLNLRVEIMHVSKFKPETVEKTTINPSSTYSQVIQS